MTHVSLEIAVKNAFCRGAIICLAMIVCSPWVVGQSPPADELGNHDWLVGSKIEEGPVGEIEPAVENSLFSSKDHSRLNNGVLASQGVSLNEVTSELFAGAKVGYDEGFLIGTSQAMNLEADNLPFQMKVNGWGQLRLTNFESSNSTINDQKQFQLKRARVIFSGSAFTEDFSYLFQLDGRSSSGDNMRLLDYLLTYDLGHHRLGLETGKIGFKTGKYKMPFHMARQLSTREIEFTDRSMASTFFDVNRSLAWGLYGRIDRTRVPVHWEAAIFNGLVTGGAETGSSGQLDNNFAYSTRLFWFPTGDWGTGELADFEGHCRLATRVGVGFANSTVDELGETEFGSVRVVDSGGKLADQLAAPNFSSEYTVSLYSIDASMKYAGWSMTCEYYFRQIGDFQPASVPALNLFDHGHWLQVGKFIVPNELEVLTRWSRVSGDSGTLGAGNQSAEEISAGFAWYIRDQHAKFTVDTTYLDGAPISSQALGIDPGYAGWLFRTQIQFAF